MNDVEILLQQARPGGQQATSAVLRLIHMGATVLDQVIKAFEMEPLNSPGLAEVISWNNTSEAAPILLKALDSGSIPLARNSMQALAASHDQSAIESLISYVLDEKKYETRRALAATALGAAKSTDVPGVLAEVVDRRAETDTDDEDAQFLLVAAIVALAKHGDHSRAPLLLRPASTPFSATQELAVKGLEVAVADGMVDALAKASRDPAPSLAKLAARPLFLLGSVQSAEILYAMAASEDSDVSNTAEVYLTKILGTGSTGDAESSPLETAWQNARSSMDEQSCYRFGLPIQFLRLSAELIEADGERTREELAGELQYRTGIDAPRALLFGTENELSSDIEEMQLTDGSLYRWGHRQDMPNH